MRVIRLLGIPEQQEMRDGPTTDYLEGAASYGDERGQR